MNLTLHIILRNWIICKK